ncbi:hypothetical protein K501DRAFT_272921 [Backusella circina FSU 941]|nr:hypothetical protein K501DRAFT_272921 [Backusella circina FSU 941]
MLKRLWKKRNSKLTLFKRGFSFMSLCSSTHLVTDAESVTDIQLKRTSVTTCVPEHRLWRKPLPVDCPLFDFSSSEETLVGHEIMWNDKDITAIIPTRHASKFYEHIPDFEEQLERACNNRRAILLSKALGRH